MEQSAIGFVSQRQLVKERTWLRILQISIGAISIILSGYVLAQPGLAIFTAVKILSIVLLFVGIQSTAVGTFSRYVRTSSRFSNIALGASAIAFSILVMALLPPPPILFSIFLAGFTLLFNGIGGIMQGMGGQAISRWFRAPHWFWSNSYRYIWSYNSTSYRFWSPTINRRYVVRTTDNWTRNNSHGYSR